MANHYLFGSETDWVCNRCGNVNWQRRKNCNVCSAPKISEVEERTGESSKVGRSKKNVNSK